MHIVCLGLSHNTASVEIRERYAIADSEVAATIEELKAAPEVREVVVVSTCNRVELYLAVDRTCVDFSNLASFFSRRGAEHQEDRGAFYRYLMPESAQHLFRVVCGLDSMVVGETEILGQIKKSYAAATDAGGTGKHLNRLFQTAFRTAKKVRSRSNITRGSVSVGSVAVELASKIFGDLKSCRVMIIGAGETGERTARSLMSRGVRTVFVSNRSYERAEALAAEMNGRAIRFEDWDREFQNLDILISSTAAPHPILTREKLLPMMRGREHRPLFIIDIAVPRDVEPEVNNIDGVYLYDIDSLQSIARQSIEFRRREMAHCEGMIAEEVSDFEMWMEAQQLDVETRSMIDKGEQPAEPYSTDPALRRATETSQ